MKRRLPILPPTRIRTGPPNLPWVQRGDASYSSPYRIIRTIRGFELWLFAPHKSGCLGREIATLNEAKGLAERHAQRERETA